MSYTCSQAEGAGFSPAIYSDTAASEPLKLTLMPNPSCSRGSETSACRPSPSSATSTISTVDPTEDELTSWLEGFHAKSSAVHLEDALWHTISGRTSSGSWQMSLLEACTPRTSRGKRSTKPPTTLSRWVTPSDALRSPRQSWVLTTFGSGIGYLHTPTCTANYSAPSMQKHPCSRAFVRVFGNPSPTNHEWLMGWPTGWSGLKPLGMGKFPQWRLRHSDY